MLSRLAEPRVLYAPAPPARAPARPGERCGEARSRKYRQPAAALQRLCGDHLLQPAQRAAYNRCIISPCFSLSAQPPVVRWACAHRQTTTSKEKRQQTCGRAPAREACGRRGRDRTASCVGMSGSAARPPTRPRTRSRSAARPRASPALPAVSAASSAWPAPHSAEQAGRAVGATTWKRSSVKHSATSRGPLHARPRRAVCSTHRAFCPARARGGRDARGSGAAAAPGRPVCARRKHSAATHLARW
jgi:hypothetical protein